MISVIQETPWSELETSIRHLPLFQQRDGSDVFPYLNATITLAEVDLTSVRPTSLYALRGNLAQQRTLRDSLLPAYDPLALAGRLILQLDDGSHIGLIPPIVEETPTEGRYLLDGLHRVLVGKEAGISRLTAVLIQNIDPAYPAPVLPCDWDEVVLYDETPTDPKLKRRYRDDQLTLRRGFTSLNGSMPR